MSKETNWKEFSMMLQKHVLTVQDDVFKAIKIMAELQAELKDKDEALKESVTLQAHYAALLNQYDGGERIVFKDVKEWLDRLQALKGKK